MLGQLSCCRLTLFFSETQLGILPTAEFDGKTLSGNATIARYLAEEHGIYSTTNYMCTKEYRSTVTVRLISYVIIQVSCVLTSETLYIFHDSVPCLYVAS